MSFSPSPLVPAHAHPWCLSVQSPLLIRTSVNGLLPVFVFVQISPSTDTRTHPRTSSHFHHLLRDYLQIQSRSEVLGVRTSAYEFGGHSSAHDTIYTLALLWTTFWCCKPGCRDDPHPKLVASTDWSSVGRPWSGIAKLFGLLIDSTALFLLTHEATCHVAKYTRDGPSSQACAWVPLSLWTNE